MIRTVDTFPQVMEGEALFSVIAYYHLWSGNSAMSQTHIELFGHPAMRASVDLPFFIRALAEHLPAGLGLSEKVLALRHTHLRYVTAFMPAEDAAQVLLGLLDAKEGLYASLGTMASIVARPSHLRFCSSCADEMRRRAGRAWWRIDHQLSGVFLCPEHGEVLRQSTVPFNAGQSTFVAATEATCPPEASPVIDEPSPRAREKLLEIAVRSSKLLKEDPRFTSLAEITDFYRVALDDVGLMTIGKQVDVARFKSAWESFYRDLEPILAPVFKNHSARNDAWVFELARKQKHGKHPLQHILFQMFLDSRPKREQPFGSGPWACPNPMADHGKGALSIVRVKEHNRRGAVVGTFSCRCGYAYTMTREPDGTLRGPRFREFGPLLDPSLIRLVEEGATLRGAAAELGIHPRVVAEAAKRLGLNKRWKAPQRAPKRAPRALSKRPRVSVCRTGGRYVSQARINWAAKDEELKAEVEVIVAEIRSASPPVSVSLKEIERRYGKGENWIFLRQKKFPLTMAVLKEQVETVGQFQDRRLRDVIRRKLDAGEFISPSLVTRAASLSSARWSDRARELIAEARQGV
jgi:hypothetical protein